MFGLVERAMGKNVVICLAVVAAVLLLTGFVVGVARTAARAHSGTARPGSVQPAPARAAPATPQPAPARAAPVTP